MDVVKRIDMVAFCAAFALVGAVVIGIF